MSYREQLGPGRGRSRWRQFVKTAYNRWIRRQAKKNPEEAPRRRWFTGYD